MTLLGGGRESRKRSLFFVFFSFLPNSQVYNIIPTDGLMKYWLEYNVKCRAFIRGWFLFISCYIYIPLFSFTYFFYFYRRHAVYLFSLFVYIPKYTYMITNWLNEVGTCIYKRQQYSCNMNLLYVGRYQKPRHIILKIILYRHYSLWEFYLLNIYYYTGWFTRHVYSFFLQWCNFFQNLILGIF